MSQNLDMGYMPFGEFVQWLEAIENAVNLRFKERTGREAEISDKCRKMLEEIGEALKAPNRAELLKEACDVIVVGFSMAFKWGFTPEEVLYGFKLTKEKLDRRWFEGKYGSHDI